MPYKDKEKQRQAQKRYYEEGRERINSAKRGKMRKWRQHTTEVKESTPCMDCGIQYPHYVMDFDHRPDEEKLCNISMGLSNFSSFEKLQEEIAKCDVVCSNCHRHRTYMKSGIQTGSGPDRA